MNGEVERGAAGRRIGPAALSVACALAALLLLDGCGATPDPAPVMPVSPTAATPSAPATAPSSGTGLRPLARDISVPSGAPPRSAVTSVNYDQNFISL